MKKNKLFLLPLIFALCLAVSPREAARAAGETPSPSPAADIGDVVSKLESLSGDIIDIQRRLSGSDSSSPPSSTPAPVYAPKIKLISPFSAAAAGNRSQDVEITLKNLGTSYASSVLVQASAAGDAPFTLSFPDGSNSFLSLLEGNTRKITLRIKVDADAASGSYPVTLTYFYKNAVSDNLSESDTLSVRIDNVQSSVNIILHNFRSDKSPIAPGDSVTITAVLENTGSAAASDAQVTIEGFDANVYLNGDASTFLKSVPGNHQSSLRVPMTVSPNARAGTYPLTFKVSYKDAGGTAVTSSYAYYVNVGSKTSEVGLGKAEITGIVSPQGVYASGQDFTFNVEIKSNGDADASNVKVVAASEDGSVVPKSANTRMIGRLAPGETRSVAFSFAATAGAKTQNYVISFKLFYESGAKTDAGAAEVVTLEQYAGVNVSIPNESPSPSPSPGAGVSKPKIVIDSYAADPQIVKAGQNFGLKLVFKNTHKSKAISNIKIVLAALETTTQAGSVFTPVDCSNTIFIDEIAPGGTYEKELTMYTVPDAVPRTYTIGVNYDYQDPDFNNYTETEQIGISVKQATKLETSEITIPTEGSPGQPISLNFNIINSGKVDLANLRVSVTANMDTANANAYLGSLKQGSSSYFDGYIVPTEPGTQAGVLVISCEDSTGEVVSIEKEFQVNVMDYDGMGGEFDYGKDGFPMPFPEDTGGAAGGFLGMFKSLSRALAIAIEASIAAAALILIVVVPLTVRRGRKRRRQEEDNE